MPLSIRADRLAGLLRQMDYLSYEIDYALLRCQLADADGPVQEVLRGRLEFLRDLAATARREINEADSTSMSTCDFAQMAKPLLIIGPTLESMTHSIVQRRWRTTRKPGTLPIFPTLSMFTRGQEKNGNAESVYESDIWVGAGCQ